MSLIEAKGVTVRLGGSVILANVSLSLSEREIVTIVGPNGSGKSTLLKTLLGAVVPSKGRVTRMDGLRVGYVPQTLHIDPTLPLPVLRFLGLPKRVSRDVALRALERTGVASLTDRQVADLSGGQMQRVLLARAIIDDPQVLVLDEPTQGLDQPGSAEFYRLIETLREDLGCGVLMVSHELHVVMAASDRVICLNGHVCCEGAPEHVATAPEYRALFGTGTQGALALYRHEHNHSHDHDHAHEAAE
ncbi:metal ABC transporter ATP-binding protein [Marivita sp. S6314]|uniref:ATP-binding cassette domain-containing protein n=1 Tax=Marivita sp. S6314 TaxID=2926406 RepID=UPI001FF5D206|nr:metal ABC transporter ATP-binding protein [Marivita sp. S6314]MCK0150202.1 metal ABC transporter ATP-binding protein [Marivita sp. S6314]